MPWIHSQTKDSEDPVIIGGGSIEKVGGQDKQSLQ